LLLILLLSVVCYFARRNWRNPERQDQVESGNENQRQADPARVNRYHDLNVVLGESPENQPLLRSHGQIYQSMSENPFVAQQAQASSLPSSFFATINPKRLFKRQTSPPPTRHISMEDIPLESPPPSYTPTAPKERETSF
jgi:hypothetical protein